MGDLNYIFVKADFEEFKINLIQISKLEEELFGEFAWTESQILYDLCRKFELSLLLKIDKKLLGYCIASFKIDHIHIHRFCVSKNYQKQGIGKQLLNTFMKQNLNSTITLKVDKANHSAIEFYKKASFHVITEENGYLFLSFPQL
jgi:ribosomal protein S18 acetylase RimI-like enzyme